MAKRRIEQYTHEDKERLNNPEVGLAGAEKDGDSGRKQYQYDPHLDPQLQWAGKAERTAFEVPTVSLHVHERIDPRSIIEAVRKRNGADPEHAAAGEQMGLFEQPSENLPLKDAIDFYGHAHDWSNRLIAGDSLLVMNSLLEKEDMAGKVQMIYIDPPYGIRYGSNFQPFVDKRNVQEKDQDLTAEPEMLKAFRDTWELGIHSYLTYMRDRLLLARELLHESGSVFVQIGDENVHLLRQILDEVFGADNFIGQIPFKKTSGTGAALIEGIADYMLWYSRNRQLVKYRPLYFLKRPDGIGGSAYRLIETEGGERRAATAEELGSESSRLFRASPLTSERPAQGNDLKEYTYEGRTFTPGKGTFKTDEEGLNRLAAAGRIIASSARLQYVRYLDDFPVAPVTAFWTDTQSGSGMDKVFVVQTNPKVIQRCILMTTDPGDLVLDPTCGSGTTAVVAEQWGRRWITCDTSRVAVTLAKQRLMTQVFDYYKLADEQRGVGGNFVYKTVPHITLKSIANNPEIKEGMTRAEIDRAIARYAEQETLHDQPEVDQSRARVTGPFTVEAVPAPRAFSPDELEQEEANGKKSNREKARERGPVDSGVAREGESLRQSEWRDELLKTGIRARGKSHIRFARLEPLPGARALQADGETVDGQRVVVAFGPEYAPLGYNRVEDAVQEAQKLVPKPELVVFAAFEFDPVAAQHIEELNWPGVTLHLARMNADLLTEDLKKKRSSNESFWLMGRPDIDVKKIAKGADKGQFQVAVKGFDYYNPATGEMDSGKADRIAMWMLDPDYDGRSMYPRQVFFPMAGDKDGWTRLAKNLNAEIDESLIEEYRGVDSLPFAAGKHKRIAVKIVDNRGIESLRVLELK